MYVACLRGDKKLVSELVKNGNKDWNSGLSGACSGGHTDLALLMIDKGATNWNSGLHGACLRGKKDLVLLMIEKGANDWTWGLHWACQGRYKDTALLMIEKGADIDICWLHLDEFDIDYLLDKKVKEFGKFKELADLCNKRRKLADQVFKELNLRDVDSIIYTY